MTLTSVSIIIPTLNEEKYLPLCLDSISCLDYDRELIEIIVVDNGSTDQTREIAKSYGIKVFCDDSKNVSGLRNLGASKATGSILAFVDADCIVSKDWLSNALIYAERNDVAAWGSPPIVPDDSTWVQQTWYLVRKKDQIVKTVDWLESMNLFVRKHTFNSVRGFNETLVTCEDVDFSYRLKKYGDILSDSRIKVTHLGEAKTVRDFFKKELWRGRSNIQGIFSHGITINELPSLSIPVYFGIFLPALFISYLVTSSNILLALSLTFYITPFIYVLFKKRRELKFSMLLKLLYLLNIYFFVRTIAILNLAKT
jgi:glycosyltransferase involved in cell wall biosynthesis